MNNEQLNCHSGVRTLFCDSQYPDPMTFSGVKIWWFHGNCLSLQAIYFSIHLKLSKQLAAAEETKKLHAESQKKNLRYADVFTDLAKLVFGGIIIGGVFENMVETNIITKE